MRYLIFSVVFLAACSSPAHVAGTAVAIDAPLGLPPVPIPSDNPPTQESIALGRKLFFDAILSADDTVSCASCHDRVIRRYAQAPPPEHADSSVEQASGLTLEECVGATVVAALDMHCEPLAPE